MNTTTSLRKPLARHKGVSTYQQNQISNLSPNELILKLYDLAIVSIKKDDTSKANLAITELIAALNFDYQEISVGLFRLYRYCQNCLRRGDHQEPVKILEDLRKTWAVAFNLT